MRSSSTGGAGSLRPRSDSAAGLKPDKKKKDRSRSNSTLRKAERDSASSAGSDGSKKKKKKKDKKERGPFDAAKDSD